MKDETKQEIQILLDLLKGSLTRNGVSMATDNSDNLMFFDTTAYIKSKGKEFDGFRININDLVK
jgi:hypothetical protein|nr:MAG TPA: hypothetical protein [Caudoviricetes sp.]